MLLSTAMTSGKQVFDPFAQPEKDGQPNQPLDQKKKKGSQTHGLQLSQPGCAFGFVHKSAVSYVQQWVGEGRNHTVRARLVSAVQSVRRAKKCA